MCGSSLGMCVSIVFCPTEPHLCVTKMIFFAGHFVANPATNVTKNKRRIRPKCKKHENTTVLKKQKCTICVYKCWLNCQLASFEALRSLAKKHRRTNAIVERGQFFASCRTKTISVKSKRISVVTDWCFFWGQKKKGPRRTSQPKGDMEWGSEKRMATWTRIPTGVGIPQGCPSGPAGSLP